MEAIKVVQSRDFKLKSPKRYYVHFAKTFGICVHWADWDLNVESLDNETVSLLGRGLGSITRSQCIKLQKLFTASIRDINKLNLIW